MRQNKKKYAQIVSPSSTHLEGWCAAIVVIGYMFRIANSHYRLNLQYTSIFFKNRFVTPEWCTAVLELVHLII